MRKSINTENPNSIDKIRKTDHISKQEKWKKLPQEYENETHKIEKATHKNEQGKSKQDLIIK